MSKICSLCKQDKPLNEFHKKASGKHGVRSQCKECRKAPLKEWQIDGKRTCVSCHERKLIESFTLSHTGSPRKYCKECRQRFTVYGLTKADLDKLLTEQDYKCLICEAFLEKFAVDHDHSCCPSRHKSCGKCVRGLLCTQCNTRLGWFEVYGTKAIEYLERYGGE